MRVVLTIAGSDPSAGAGIQADLKAIAASGGYGVTAITAITAQNGSGVSALEPVSAALVRAQLDALFDGFDVAAVKSGMLATAEIVRAVAAALRQRCPPHYVLDPVIASTTGHPLLAEDAREPLLRDLLPLATLVTPNAHEAEALTGLPVTTPQQAEAAGRRLLELGARAVLVKGGHFREGAATDVLVTPDGTRMFPGEFIDAPSTHGSGCTYASAIATNLAHGMPLTTAVALAKQYLTAAMRAGLDLGGGGAAMDHFFFMRRKAVKDDGATESAPEGGAP